MVVLEAHPHNIHRRAVGTMAKDGSIWSSHWENDMVHNCADGPSMFNHLGSPTTILKGEPSTHIK